MFRDFFSRDFRRGTSSANTLKHLTRTHCRTAETRHGPPPRIISIAMHESAWVSVLMRQIPPNELLIPNGTGAAWPS
jgi:hypothetical protein